MTLPKILKTEITRENIVLVGILVILLAIPLTVVLLGIRQELRKRAIEANGAILVNAGAETTNSREVTLALTAPAGVTPPPTQTFSGDAADGMIFGLARDTSSNSEDGTETIRVGQQGVLGTANRRTNRGYVLFDTSGIPDNATITAVKLCLRIAGVGPLSNPFDVGIHKFNFSTPLGGSREQNYDGALAAPRDQVLTSLAIGGSIGPEVCNTVGLDPAWVSKTGYTKYALLSSRDVADQRPEAHDYEAISFYSANSQYPPRLEVTYTAPTAQTPSLISTAHAQACAGCYESCETGTGTPCCDPLICAGGGAPGSVCVCPFPPSVNDCGCKPPSPFGTPTPTPQPAGSAACSDYCRSVGRDGGTCLMGCSSTYSVHTNWSGCGTHPTTGRQTTCCCKSGRVPIPTPTTFSQGCTLSCEDGGTGIAGCSVSGVSAASCAISFNGVRTMCGGCKSWQKRFCDVEGGTPSGNHTAVVTAYSDSECAGQVLASCSASFYVNCDFPQPTPPVCEGLEGPDQAATGSFNFFRISGDPGSYGLYGWQASCGSFADFVGNTNTWTAPETPGTCTITGQVTDGLGGVGECTKEVTVVAIPPSGVEEVRVSNTADFSGEPVLSLPWPSGTTTHTVQWILTAGDGLKTVWAKFKVGGVWTTPVSDSITLDTSAEPTPTPAATCGNGTLDQGEECDPEYRPNGSAWCGGTGGMSGGLNDNLQGCRGQCVDKTSGRWKKCNNQCLYDLTNYCSSYCGGDTACDNFKVIGVDECAPGKVCNERCQCAGPITPTPTPTSSPTPTPTAPPGGYLKLDLLKVLFQYQNPSLGRGHKGAVILALKQGNTVVLEKEVRLDENGEAKNVELPGVEAGTYNAFVYEPGYLTKKLANVQIKASGNTLDFTKGGTEYFLVGDFNGDQEVNVLDFTIFVNSYGKQGEE